MKTRMPLKTILKRRKYYALIVFLIGIQSGFSQSGKTIQPEIDFSPLWVAAEYGLYWGVSITNGLVFMKHHKISLCADLAPVGLLGMTDVDTEGKKQHWGGTLGYLFQIGFGNNLIRIEPGAIIGLFSIPYIYGTYPGTYIDNATSPKKIPEREIVWGMGPELRISIGKNRVITPAIKQCYAA